MSFAFINELSIHAFMPLSCREKRPTAETVKVV